MPQPRIIIVTELYWPERTSTGRYLTEIASFLAEKRPVRVLCAQPTYSRRGIRAPSRDRRKNVLIRRVWSTTFDKNNLLGRAANALTFGISVTLAALSVVRPGDVVMAVTNPPFLPALAAAVAAVKRGRFVLLVHDVYPEALHAANLISAESILSRLVEVSTRKTLRASDAVIVLGRDMQALVEDKVRGATAVIAIPHWADAAISPVNREENRVLRAEKIPDRFVVQYAGNMGTTHDIDSLLEAASILNVRMPGQFHFLFVGTGRKRERVAREVRAGLGNVSLLGPQPDSDWAEVLGACDVALLSMVKGMRGVSVPSRMYNIMASGRPLIAMADEQSEPARVILEEGIGWVVPPHDVHYLVEVLILASMSHNKLLAMGRRGVRAAREKYSLEKSAARYQEVVASVLA